MELWIDYGFIAYNQVKKIDGLLDRDLTRWYSLQRLYQTKHKGLVKESWMQQQPILVSINLIGDLTLSKRWFTSVGADTQWDWT